MSKGSIPRPCDKERFDKNFDIIYRKTLTKTVTIGNNRNVTNCNKEKNA